MSRFSTNDISPAGSCLRKTDGKNTRPFESALADMRPVKRIFLELVSKNTELSPQIPTLSLNFYNLPKENSNYFLLSPDIQNINNY